MTRPILFIDRDGCLIEEPADQQVDSLEKLRLMPGVVPALLELRAAGFELVLVSNQDGLGSDVFPQEAFLKPHELMMQIFTSQGIRFAAEHIDPTLPEDRAPTRKPGIGMLLDYLPVMDRDRSAVIGDRETDMQLAENLGIRGFRVGPEGKDWPFIARAIVGRPRTAEVRRETGETTIHVRVDLDVSTPAEISTGIGFFDHMLEQLAAHGGFSLRLSCEGDLHIDEHHTVEDCALALGQALSRALSNRHGIGRFGFVLPMDEARASVAVDLSGRPFYVQEGEFARQSIGGLHTEMVSHFFRSLSQSLGAAVHIVIAGDDTHHMVEACFKGVGRALRPALARADDRMPSTKGIL